MNIFQTVVIFTPSEEKTIKRAIKKYKNMIQAGSPKKVTVEDMGRRALAYKIRDNDFGHYALFTYAHNTSFVPELERQFRIDDLVLKFMTVQLDEITAPELDDYIFEEAEIKSEQESDTPGKINALDILLPDIHLTNNEKYDIILARQKERRNLI